MKTARYGDAQIMGILRQAESGVPVSALYREHGMGSAIFYKWRSKYGGFDTPKGHHVLSIFFPPTHPG